MDDRSQDHRLDFLSYASSNRVPRLPSVGRPLHQSLSILALGELNAELLQLWTTQQAPYKTRLFPLPWRSAPEGPLPPTEEEEEEEEPLSPAPIEEVEVGPMTPMNVECVAISRPGSRQDRWVGPECLTLLLAAAGDQTDPRYPMTLDTFAPRPRDAERLLVSLAYASDPSQQRRLRRVKANSMTIRRGGGTIRLQCEDLRGIPSMAERMQSSTAFYVLLSMCALRAERSFWKDVDAWLDNEVQDVSGALSGKDHTTIGISTSHAYLADRLPLQVGVGTEGKDPISFRKRLDELCSLRIWDEPSILIRNREYRNLWLPIPPETPNEHLNPVQVKVHELSEESHDLCHRTRERLYEFTLRRWDVRWEIEHAVSLAMGSSLPRDGPLVVFGSNHSADGAKDSVRRVLCLNVGEFGNLLKVTAEIARTVRWTSGDLHIYKVVIQGVNRRAQAWLKASAAFFGIPARDPVFVREFYNGAWQFILEKAPEIYPSGEDSVEIEVPFLRVPPAPLSLSWPQLPSPIEPGTTSVLPRVSVTGNDIQKARDVLTSLT